MLRAIPFLAVLGIVGLISCTLGPDRSVNYDPSADFGSYRSYHWISDARYQLAKEPIPSVTQKRIRSAIDRTLASKAFTHGQKGDFGVAFTGGRAEVKSTVEWAESGNVVKLNTPDLRQRARPVEAERAYTRGTLIIEIYDAASKRRVWRGSTSTALAGERATEQQIQAAVEKILAKFPPK